MRDEEKQDIKDQFQDILQKQDRLSAWKEADLPDVPQQYAQSLLDEGLKDGMDIMSIFAWISQRLVLDFGLSSDEAHEIADAIVPDFQVQPRHVATLPDVPPHKVVWLTQPNNDSLKYWHHKPTNTTYAWNFWGGYNDEDRHHWEMAKHLHIVQGDHPYKSFNNDWDGGFYTQLSGKHPADIWGLPTSVDYAPIEGGY